MSHTIFQTAQIMPINHTHLTPTTKLLSSSSPMNPLLPFSNQRAVPVSRRGLVVRNSSAVVDGDAVAGLERCFKMTPPEYGGGDVVAHGPVMKGQYGAFGAVTLEKSKLDMTQKQTKSSPEKIIMIKLEVSGNTSKKEQLKWTEIMDNAFIQAMITQQDKGNRINGTFTTQAYANMIEELTTKLPRDIIKMEITKNHLRNRLKTLKIRFSQWYDMFRGTSLSGFSWNPDTQLIEAEDEVWNKLIESKPEAASLKTKKVSNYNELLALFARDRASGIHAETAKEMNARLNNNDTINIETITDVDDLLATNEITLENEYNIEDDIQVLGEEIYKELAPMGLESHEIPKALNYLATNQAKARTLFSCPPEIRMDVLKDMMGADK